MPSLYARLLITFSLILICFLGLTGITLYNIFRDNLLEAYHEKLLGQVYALVAASEIHEDGTLTLADPHPELRYSIADSGLYGQITRNDGTIAWRSRSMGERIIPFVHNLARGQQYYEVLQDATGRTLHSASIGILWDEARPLSHGFTFAVAELPENLNFQLSQIKRKMSWALAAVMIVLLMVQTILIRWVLSPLRHVAGELHAIARGAQDRLQYRYPRELKGLTDSLNDLLQTRQQQLNRYRNSLADLSHSLKTPLALLKGAIAMDNTATSKLIEEQVTRMSQIIDYQLQRAATSGRNALSSPINLQHIITKITASLDKVYADKQVALTVDIPKELALAGDEGDLMELLGNVLDNAYKWCAGKVSVSCLHAAAGINIKIEDDGPGIAESRREHIQLRGVRADEQITGHGIGMAIVLDILQAYGGKLTIGTSAYGGATITLMFPENQQLY